jgi:hypothetical protein
MPKIADVAGAAEFVFPNDHPPPHMHVRFQGAAVRLRITDATPLDQVSTFPTRVLRDARNWLLQNRDRAAEVWAAYHE